VTSIFIDCHLSGSDPSWAGAARQIAIVSLARGCDILRFATAGRTALAAHALAPGGLNRRQTGMLTYRAAGS
jgi:hypothetical protein